jgi:hypothetical protein
MPPIILDNFLQRSPQWIEARLGNPGASSISKIITSKGEPSKQREDYLLQLAAERITGRCEEGGFLSQHMINGIEREEPARALFEMITGLEVRQVGIVYKDERRHCHCSPDGLISDDAILELKNPMAKTHIRSLIDGTLPPEYFSQCMMSLYVCERDLLYFMSNADGLPPLILEVRPDEKYIEKLAKALDDFWADLEKTVEKIKAMKGTA